MKMSEIHQMTKEEIEIKLENLKEDLLKERFRRYTENPQDVTRVRKIKRDIARLKTALREMELGINKNLYVGNKEE